MSQTATIFIVSNGQWSVITANSLPGDTQNLQSEKTVPLCILDESSIADIDDICNAFGYVNYNVININSTYASAIEFLNTLSLDNIQQDVKPGDINDVSFEVNTNKFDDVFAQQGLIEATYKEIPEEGDSVYIEPHKTLFCEFKGGLATISAVHKVSKIDVELENEDDDDELQESSNVYFIELKELPGISFGWNLLKNKQSELKDFYNKANAELINL